MLSRFAGSPYSFGLDGRVFQPKLALVNVPSEIFDVPVASIPSPCRPFFAWTFHRAVSRASAVVGIGICHFIADSISQHLLARNIRSSYHLAECLALPASSGRNDWPADAKIGTTCQSERLVAIDDSQSNTCSVDRDGWHHAAGSKRNLSAEWL
jgi:hypothetical protein